MDKVQDTKFVQNNQGASHAQKEDTDQDNATDPMREQRRFNWSDCQGFQTKPEYADWAIVAKQWEDAMASVIKPAKNGAGEFLRLQVGITKVQPVQFCADHCVLFRGQPSPWQGKGGIVTTCS